MESKKYEEYLKKWDKYWKDEKDYYQKRKELIKRENQTDEDLTKELYELEKTYGHDGFNQRQFGPFTVIDNQLDLLNPNFMLPGYDCSFSELTNTDKNIPSYFGKRLISKMKSEEESGIVIGYSYDATDDYIMIKYDNGTIGNILVNSHYTVEDES